MQPASNGVLCFRPWISSPADLCLVSTAFTEPEMQRKNDQLLAKPHPSSESSCCLTYSIVMPSSVACFMREHSIPSVYRAMYEKGGFCDCCSLLPSLSVVWEWNMYSSYSVLWRKGRVWPYPEFGLIPRPSNPEFATCSTSTGEVPVKIDHVQWLIISDIDFGHVVAALNKTYPYIMLSSLMKHS